MPDRAQPPVAPRTPVVRDLHGQRDVDNYAWMRDHSAPAMQEYLAAERAYYDAETSHLAALTKELYDEAVARTPQGSDDSVSWTLRGYRYLHRTPAGAEGKQLIRWRDGESPADGRVLLDEDVVSADTGFVDVGTCEPSPDNRLLAWSADTSGAEIYELRFRDTATGQDRADVIERTYPGGAWAARLHALLLPGAGRAVPAVPDVAARGRRRARQRRPRLRGERRAVLPDPGRRAAAAS